VLSFKAIPYAAAPIGALRWARPAPAAPWSQTRDASRWGDLCIQLGADDQPVGSEDCLTLNVWAPDGAAPGSLPVMVFMHGGSNVVGSASDPWLGVEVYDGAWLAEHGPAVVVTIQYRLGVMGFLAHPAFAAENPEHATGSFGLMDQLFALKWVQRNIALFGGDPQRVLLFGQSAGAYDTCALLSSPLAAGSFSRALLMSGGCYAEALPGYATQNARLVARRLSCGSATDVAACLRALSADAVERANTSFEIGSGGFYYPVVDGHVLVSDPLKALQAGTHQHVPIVVGTTRREMSQFIDWFVKTRPTTDADYQADVVTLFGNAWAPSLLQAYPSASYASPEAALEALLADMEFLCPSFDVSQAAAQHQSEPVFRYVFSHSFEKPALGRLGAAHGFDLFFAFHNLSDRVVMPSPAELQLADEMAGYWVRFAATGDPNGAGAPLWPRYDAASHQHLVLDSTITTASDDPQVRCQVWTSLYGGA
jgi:para-nitrobenzyl esterase